MVLPIIYFMLDLYIYNVESFYMTCMLLLIEKLHIIGESCVIKGVRKNGNEEYDM